MSTPIPESNLTAIHQAIFANRKIEAIKLYRDATNCDLKEAKDAVEKMQAELRAASPEKFTASGKGCLAVVVMVCVMAVLAVLFFHRL